MAAKRINQICVASPCCHDASCAHYCWDSRFQMEPAFVIDLRHGQRSELGGRCVQDFLLRRIVNIIETGSGLYRVDYPSATGDVQRYHMVSTGDEEEASLGVERQSLQISGPGVPLGYHSMAPHIYGDCISGFLKIRVEQPTAIVYGVTFR